MQSTANPNNNMQEMVQLQIDKPVLRRGSQGAAVEELQNLLTYWKVYTGPVNSNFGPQTEEAVKAYQRRVFLTEDGIVGKLTWEALYTGAPVNMPELRRGSRGQLVSTVQRILKSTGDYAGQIDADFGPRTEAAVKAFQQRSALPVTGIIAERTWHALSKIPH
jgi:peptidoglycan hydrolase-like protein with peptidoglycan-binding domain